jgi:hypothetical protein
LAHPAPIVAAVELAADAGEPDAAMWLGVELGCGVWLWAAADAEVPPELQAAAARLTPSATAATPISLGFIAIISAPSTWSAHENALRNLAMLSRGRLRQPGCPFFPVAPSRCDFTAETSPTAGALHTVVRPDCPERRI